MTSTVKRSADRTRASDKSQVRLRQGDHRSSPNPSKARSTCAPTGTVAGARQLPDLVAALHNSQVNFDLLGHVEGVHGQIRNTFEAVPDAPVTGITLDMQGGSKGLLVNSTDLCEHRHFDTNLLTAQNGKTADQSTRLAVSCPKRGREGRKHHKRGKR